MTQSGPENETYLKYNIPPPLINFQANLDQALDNKNLEQFVRILSDFTITFFLQTILIRLTASNLPPPHVPFTPTNLFLIPLVSGLITLTLTLADPLWFRALIARSGIPSQELSGLCVLDLSLGIRNSLLELTALDRRLFSQIEDPSVIINSIKQALGATGRKWP